MRTGLDCAGLGWETRRCPAPCPADIRASTTDRLLTRLSSRRCEQGRPDLASRSQQSKGEPMFLTHSQQSRGEFPVPDAWREAADLVWTRWAVYLAVEPEGRVFA